MAATTSDLAYFRRQQAASNPEFWRRFDRRPIYEDKRVLDLGCGHGALCIEIAQAGASAVLGVDVDRGLIHFARDNLERNYPQLRHAVRFELAEVRQLDLERKFDLIVSKDTFEHVADMQAMVATLYNALRPGGELWAGFSPLYHSPRGDHARTGLRVPWAHAILPRALVLRAATRHNARLVSSLEEIGLNGMTPREFRSYAVTAGFEIDGIAYNCGEKRLVRLLRELRRFPRLEKHATVSVYAVLRRPGAQ